MTYTYYALREGPIGLWSFDALPLNDSSGYGNHATYTGTPTTTRPIVAGGIAAQHIDAGDTINYPIDSVMIAGRESRAFSLEAWIKPQSGTAALLARDDSGLFLDGLILRFTVSMGVTTSVEYNHLNAGEVYHVVATYDSESIMLFVNGEMVSFALVEEGGVFSDTTTNLKTTMSTAMVMDAPAVYNYALTYSMIRNHYAYGTNYPEVVNLSLLNGGKSYMFSDNDALVYDKIEFGSELSWSSGLLDPSLTVIDNRLVNVYDDVAEEWVGGTWTYQYSVDAEIGEDVTINGSRINWYSNAPITVEYSVDDITWTPVSNGGSVTGIQDLSSGYAVSIRVIVPDTTTEQAFVDSLSVVFYQDKSIRGSDESLLATFINPLTVTLAGDNYEPASFSDNAGVMLPANSGFSIPADTDFDPYFAVEMTVRFDTSTASTTVLAIDNASITSNSSGQWTFTGLSALYVDGVAVTSPFSIASGKWHHVLAVLSTEKTAPVYVGNNSAGSSSYPMRVGYLALYASTIPASMAKAIYDTWVGAPAVKIVESDIPVIEETEFSTTGEAFRAYAFNWAITGAG
jgi:hypothetical protein